MPYRLFSIRTRFQLSGKRFGCHSSGGFILFFVKGGCAPSEISFSSNQTKVVGPNENKDICLPGKTQSLHPPLQRGLDN